MKLLHLIASPRGEQSRTCQIAQVLIDELAAKIPNLQITNLNLFETDLPPIGHKAASAKYSSIMGATLDSQEKYIWDRLTQIAMNFLSHDYIVISAPMWNFNVPYALKHYIDVIMQPGLLFNFTSNGVVGKAINKKMYCVTTRGNDYSAGTYMHQFDFLEPYIRSIFGMAGISDISFINAQPMDYMPTLAAEKLEQAKVQAQMLAANEITHLNEVKR